MRRAGFGVVAALLALAATGAGGAADANVARTVRSAARAYHVPARLLLRIGYLHTRWTMPTGPAIDGGYGPMDLTPVELRRAARLARVDPVRARRDLDANVRAGAALLRATAHGNGRDAWAQAVEELWGAPQARELFGSTARAPAAVSAARADYPGARWLPAARADYAGANRPISDRITKIVIHSTEGSYAGTLSWFRNPAAQVSSHYVVRSSDGEITQMVREKDEAWHAGNGAVNASSIGIEHEAFRADCRWYTDAMYRSSAQLTAYLATKYVIPVDRKHVIGHAEVPDPNHSGQFGGYSHHIDPGRCWDWTKYMALVRDFAGSRVGPTLQRVVDDAGPGFGAPRGWRRSTSAGAYARSFVKATPSQTAQPVRFALKLPVDGSYALYGWWPSGQARNASVPIGIETPAGQRWIRVDQRKGSGWTYLGSFALAAKGSRVLVSPRTTAAGSIAADAIKVELLTPPAGAGLASTSDGWAATARGLSATRDGGASWTQLAVPGVKPAQVRGVRFAPGEAWVIAATGTAARSLALFHTANGGVSWTQARLPAPRDLDVAAPADVAAPDAAHLYVALRLQPNRWSLSRGALLRSNDGGTTWTKRALPTGGAVAFPTAVDGWLVGGLAHERLFATHDGGGTWKQVRPPSALTRPASKAYALPTFTTETDGVLPVSLAAGTRSKLAFETTIDGGRSWSVAASVKVGKALAVASSAPTAVVDDTLWLAAVGTKLVAVQDGGLSTATVGKLPGTVDTLHFASPTVGWTSVRTPCATAAGCPLRLFATADGGVTWTRLRPP